MATGYAGLMAALAVILGLLFLALKLIRRIQGGRASGGTEVPLKLVQRIPIGPRQGVGLLQAGDRLLVISIAESGARLLTELDGSMPSGIDTVGFDRLAGGAAASGRDPGRQQGDSAAVRGGISRKSSSLWTDFGSLLSRSVARNAAPAKAPQLFTARPASEPAPALALADEMTAEITNATVAPHPALDRLVWAGRRSTRVRLEDASLEIAGVDTAALAPKTSPDVNRAAAADSPEFTVPAPNRLRRKNRPASFLQIGRKLGWVALFALVPATANGFDRNGDVGPDELRGAGAVHYAGAESVAPEAAAPAAPVVTVEAIARRMALHGMSAGLAGLNRAPTDPGLGGLAVTSPVDAKIRPSANASGNGGAAAASTSSNSPASVFGLPGSLPSAGPRLDLSIGNGKDDLHLSGAVGMVVFMGALTLLPALLLLMTSFTRILIVLQFLRPAIGTQSAPPVQLLVALSLLLTGVVMNPVMQQANRDAIQPYMKHSITETEALNRGLAPFRGFMLRNINEKDLGMFVELSGDAGRINAPENVGTLTLASAFVTSELRTAFQMGFLIFIPFIIVDLIVASVLMSLGMFMLPPLMVSLPFKLLLFVLADGWSLVVKNLVLSFR